MARNGIHQVRGIPESLRVLPGDEAVDQLPSYLCCSRKLGAVGQGRLCFRVCFLRTLSFCLEVGRLLTAV